ncbi:MAG: crossover junction endodeoxyribonuclease RuvC [Ignavibacteria bacterium GWB2_35_6b]|nr:MAG: crossover junction endodeoxyribonuclease RuvC [Ignavibacteria bacterium GWB2_35_6b]
MIIFGVDPGTICTGFGIIKHKNSELINIHSGIIKPPPDYKIPIKLEFIYNELDRLIKKYSPDEFSIETAFYGKNVQSALKIGYVRGISLLAAVHNGLPTGEYSPREIKKSVVGNGAASKEQVQFMVKKLLYLKKDKMKFDESDALAVAICHAFKVNSPTKKSGSWKAFIEANPGRVIE